MSTRLPGTDDDPGDSVVLHVDMDCFYASCERLREPRLRDEPVVVGMGYEPGTDAGAVATASYEARAHGVESAQPISGALELLPRRGDERGDGRAGSKPTEDGEATGYYRPVDMPYYESVAEAVKAVLHDVGGVVREVSVDEAYLDATDQTSWERADDGRPLAAGVARHLKERIAREVGAPASVGVAPNMATAKVASDHDKPDGLTVVPPDDVESFLAPIPVEELHGVGPVRARALRDLGLETAGDVADADPAVLRERLGDPGRELYDRARGRDDRAVTPRGRPKSLSRESAFREATDDPERVRDRLRALAADVAERARSEDALYRTIGTKIVEPPFDVSTRARSLSGPVDAPDLVEEITLELFEEFAGREVRKVGVRVSKLSFASGEQASLDGFDAAAGDPAAVDPRITDGEESSRTGRSDRRDGQSSLTEFE